MKKPLEGIKVVDLTTFVAAPVTARMLADLGAEVIKIEPPAGDGWRLTGISYVPTRFSREENPVFDIYNSGKKMISVNLKTEDGQEIFHRLISDADIFVTNVREAALKRMKVSYDDLKDKYPRLIYAQVIGFGHKGPDSEIPAFDTTAFWTRTGFIRDLAVIGENGTYDPIYPPSGMGDTVTGYVLLSQVNLALYQRTVTGKGQLVEACLYHSGIFTMGTMQITNQRPFGRVFPRSRADHAQLGGYYKCKDGEYIFIAAGLVARLLGQIAGAIGRPDLLDDPRYNTPEARLANRDEFYKLLSAEFMKKTSDEWLVIAKEHDFAATKLCSFADISEDEQALANGFVETIEYPNGHTDMIAVPPFHMSSIEEPLTTKPTPPVGGNTDEVLRSLGYTEEQIALFKERGSVMQAE